MNGQDKVGSRDQRNGQACKQMQIRSKVGSREKGDGPQSRAHQTASSGGKNGTGADVTSSPRAVTDGQVTR